MTFASVRSQRVIVLALVASVILIDTLALATPPSGILIRVGEHGTPEVIPIDPSTPMDLSKQSGLFVWSDHGREHCRPLPTPEQSQETIDALAPGSRFDDANPHATGAGHTTMATVQLSQLRGLSRMRGGWFLTPTPNAYLLNPKITIRRRPDTGPTQYPAAELLLAQRREIIVRIPFGAGQAKVEWSKIVDLPESLKQGLPAGRYALRTEDGTEEVRFEVATPEVSQQVMYDPHRLANLLTKTDESIYLLVAVQRLLGQVGQDGEPQPFLADALDLLETVSPSELTAHLQETRDEILAQLTGTSPSTAIATSEDPTGIESIDQARMMIAQARWKDAMQILSRVQDEPARERGLALLYEAVILSESGATTEELADRLFVEAIRQLDDAEPEDRVRAYNNYANYLLGRAQDRLYNHAFQIASGVEQPLIHALRDWREAAAQYEAALDVAQTLPLQEQASLQVNVARLYSLIGDVIRTLDVPVAGKQQFLVGQEAADQAIRRFATKALDANDHMTRAIGNEVLAQLAFRQRNWGAGQDYVQQSLEQYLECGSLAGVESTQRLLGLWYMQRANSAAQTAEAAKIGATALRHLEVSQLIGELLRKQIPADQIGRSRAGFFARRAYVNERIVELLVGQNKHVESAAIRGTREGAGIAGHPERRGRWRNRYRPRIAFGCRDRFQLARGCCRCRVLPWRRLGLGVLGRHLGESYGVSTG